MRFRNTYSKWVSKECIYLYFCDILIKSRKGIVSFIEL